MGTRPKTRQNRLFSFCIFPEDTITKLSSKFILHRVPTSHQTNTTNMVRVPIFVFYSVKPITFIFISPIYRLGFLRFKSEELWGPVGGYIFKQSVLYFILLSAVPDFCTFFFSSIFCCAVCFQRVELYIFE